MSLARRLAERITALRYEDLPPEAVYWSRVAVLDTTGVMLAGSVEAAPRIVEDTLELHASHGPSLIFGTARRAACLDAALVNGTAAHVLDFDNTSNTMFGHVSAAMIPALIAAGEAYDAKGRDLLKAKFENCARRVLAPERVAAASRMIDSFEDVGSVRDFTTLLEPAKVGPGDVRRALERSSA